MDKKRGLAARIQSVFRGGGVDEEFFEDLEDLLVEADVGARLAMEAVDALRERAASFRSENALRQALAESLLPHAKAVDPELAPGLNIIALLGVNGVGKTTTLAKLAAFYREQAKTSRILLAAGDTFRAAAIDQLAVHAERLDMRLVRQQHGADPGAVVYDAVESAKANRDRLVLADTAGRMHTKANLVAELGKVNRIIENRGENATYRKYLVIDATTGQNGLRQAEIFNDAVGVDAIIMAKYDSTAKGGIALAIAKELGIPCAFLGRGEGYEDLEVFDSQRYVAELTGVDA
ncbi:MAG: signal recognition particle-docking protein FtsY [Spirochaetes bacterium]|jgi:fused signal recognition particle receptor|nr:signal recognition particle-docking protein FtsY [Spirochaetota bacterium]